MRQFMSVGELKEILNNYQDYNKVWLIIGAFDEEEANAQVIIDCSGFEDVILETSRSVW